MDAASNFFMQYRHLTSLVNGLAFFVLGLSIAIEGGRSSELKPAGHLSLLASYGFLAALANWIRMFMLAQNPALGSDDNPLLPAARVLCLLAAAVFLLRFSTRQVANGSERLRVLLWATPVLCAVYALVVSSILFGSDSSRANWISVVDEYARYILLLPGMAMASLGFWAQRRRFLRLELSRIARDTTGVSLAFGWKAFASGLIALPLSDTPLALSPTTTLAISTSRTFATIISAFFVLRLLLSCQMVRRRQLDTAVEERIQAQQQALESQHQMQAEIQLWASQLEDLVDSIASAMSIYTGLKPVLEVALAQVLKLTGFEAGDILILGSETSSSQLIASIGTSPPILECRASVRGCEELLATIQSSEQMVAMRNLSEDPMLTDSPCVQSGFRWLVCVGATSRSKLLGTMNLLGSGDKPPPAHVLRVLSAVGQQIGVAIEFSRFYERAQSTATLEERERLGRELHDGLAQVLSYLHLKSHKANELMSSARLSEAQEVLGEMQEVAREAQRDVRESILGLRSTVSARRGVVPVLTEYIRRFSRESEIRALVVAHDDAAYEFTPNTEIQLLRIVQEALTNVRKHSQAQNAWVRFESDGELAEVTVKDDGRGFDLSRAQQEGQPHYGLQTMRERAEAVGGDFHITTMPGQGTQLTIRLPLQIRGRGA